MQICHLHTILAKLDSRHIQVFSHDQHAITSDGMSTSQSPHPNRSTPKRSSGEIHKGASSGISSKVKESAAELINFQQDWERLHTTGVAVLNSIKILKLDAFRRNSTEQVYPQGLQERCDQLEIVVNQMESSLKNLEILVQQFGALVELDILQGGGNGPVFLSWPTEKFNQAFQDIFKAYSKELSLKKAIKEDVAHCSTKESLIYHITCWTSQPFIDNTCHLLLVSLFCETGLT
ncbi:cyclin-dependent kinase 2-interacting protein-like isoform X2 [Thrips palmi]|uniref:Cyclin-dependent kinase 2-interacting protein-like isoform X2 n=1 Tax=Thrips palmi TaxID=161013 RepID=A0A6P8ZD91_THRPL|nr:cyclin-dependent kinase 2-interacting protein-like isoform X2 [Thrips palmi]